MIAAMLLPSPLWGGGGGGGGRGLMSGGASLRDPHPAPPPSETAFTRVSATLTVIEIGNSRFRLGGGRRARAALARKVGNFLPRGSTSCPPRAGSYLASSPS